MKTLSSHVVLFFGILLLTAVILWSSDGSTWRNLISLDAGTQVVLGLGFVLILSALWSLVGGSESTAYKMHVAFRRRFAWEKKRLEIFPAQSETRSDIWLPIGLRFAGVVILTLVLCIQWISPQSPNRLQNPAAIGLSSAEKYCPDSSEPVKTPTKIKAGCELVLRAFELGYTKDLGDCQDRKPEPMSAEGICQERYRDEPILHYYGRKLAGWVSLITPSSIAQAMEDELLQTQTASKDLTGLAGKNFRQLVGHPRSSHHIWTNLPQPPRGVFESTLNLVYPGYCEQRRAKKPVIDMQGAIGDGSWFFWIIDQLLFDETFASAAVGCREFHIHWQANRNHCEQLSKNPSGVLENEGILDDIFLVMGRLGEEAGDKAKLAMEKSLSFQCLMMEDSSYESSSKRWPLAFHGFSGGIEERTWPRSRASLSILFGEVASLLAPGFSYHQLQEGKVGSSPRDLKAALAQEGFPLLRMNLLEQGDVFLGQTWFTSVEGAKEIYPWDRHAGPFIERFRRIYRLKRGRL